MTPEDEKLRQQELLHQQELQRLRNEIEMLTLERRVMEEKYNLVVSKHAIEQKNYESALSVSKLKVDWLEKARELESLKAETDAELRDAICIDFANKLRVNALADILEDPDNILVLKATAYEVYYRACVATIENRNLKVKIQARDRFTEAVKTDKITRQKKAEDRAQVEKSRDPREKMIQTMMALGLSRQDAETQVDKMNAAAKELTK